MVAFTILSSCIQSEAPNAEADILTCIVSKDVLIADPQIENDRITLLIDPSINMAKITEMSLTFTLTEGATIDPPSGTIRDFSQEQTYTVTSEDRKWEKTYTVNCIVDGILTTYNFEHYRFFTDKGVEYYHEFYEVTSDGNEQNIWGSGNGGFKLIASGKLPEEYPTVSSENGLSGRCVKLETRKTGTVGALLRMPIAAGNLFIGVYAGGFDALKATHFGLPFSFAPTGLTGYYKYKAGDVFTDKQNNIIPNKKDNFDIYAIMYETDDNVKYLDGSNSLTSPNLISIARISEEEKKETDEWTHFYLPFEMLPGKEIDPNKLANNKYNISVVFSSSIEGANFSGAEGSTLYIDQVELINLEK